MLEFAVNAGPFEVRYTPRAAAEVGAIDFEIFERIEESLDQLAADLAGADAHAPVPQHLVVGGRIVALRTDWPAHRLFVESIRHGRI